MIRVNENPIEWQLGMTVTRVLDVCGYRYPMIIVKVNGDLVKKKDFSTYEIPDRSEVKVIHMMTGG